MFLVSWQHRGALDLRKSLIIMGTDKEVEFKNSLTLKLTIFTNNFIKIFQKVIRFFKINR